MGLSKTGQATRKPIPHEPTEWMDFSRLSAYELDERMAAGGDLSNEGWSTFTLRERFDLAQRWVATCVVGWSYKEPYTPESRALLDAPTLLWAYTTAVAHNFEAETPEEKKPDSAPSTAT